MGVLKALEARLRDGEEVSGNGDGYFVRTKAGVKLGPMREHQFSMLRDSNDVREIASAWRVAGGTFYKIQLERRVICDSKHACSGKACSHAAELTIIIFCFITTVSVFYLLANSKQMEKEMKQTGKGTWRFLMVLFGLTVLTAIATTVKLVQRWSAASSETFTSEV